jgi:hypothetical protein
MEIFLTSLSLDMLRYLVALVEIEPLGQLNPEKQSPQNSMESLANLLFGKMLMPA